MSKIIIDVSVMENSIDFRLKSELVKVNNSKKKLEKYLLEALEEDINKCIMNLQQDICKCL